MGIMNQQYICSRSHTKVHKKISNFIEEWLNTMRESRSINCLILVDPKVQLLILCKEFDEIASLNAQGFSYVEFNCT